MLADYIDQASTSCIASPRCTAKIKTFLPRLCFSIRGQACVGSPGYAAPEVG